MLSRLAATTGLCLSVAVGLAGCGSATGTSHSTATPVSRPAPTVAAPSGRASAVASTAPQAGQTDTEWGRIWDSLPPGFPTYPGSTPADDAATGPASATLAVDGDAAKAIANWMEAQLQGEAYTAQSLSGPLEDGSYVLDSVGAAAGCQVQVTAAPRGSLTIVTVMYGAACPNG